MVVGEEPVNVIEQPKWTRYVAEIKSWVFSVRARDVTFIPDGITRLCTYRVRQYKTNFELVAFPHSLLIL